MDNGHTIKAAPTKEFFIYMLTKDIKLERAIIDLIDNSIDGAKSERGEGNYKGLWIKININDQGFSIEDNCGGFSLEVAKEYAFMFGRRINKDNKTLEDNEVKRSVGRFGVGMKRALFKIGNNFEVESKHKLDHFKVKVDVEAWSREPEKWEFSYNSINNGDLADSDGTYIKVSNLNDDVIDEFRSDIFIKNLKEEIERTLSFTLHKGLNIYLNDIQLKRNEIVFLENDLLKPFYVDFNREGVNIKVFAGIGEPNPDYAGWYIYCNDRLVVEKDKTSTTGWDTKRYGGNGIAKYHNIYAMFRGIVFFSADDSKLLPMTTTKTGVDSNSVVFKAARDQMIVAMTQVMTFLKELNSEEDRDELVTISERVNVVQLSEATTYVSKFIYPKSKNDDNVYFNNKINISFQAEKDKVELVKKFFRVKTNRECGESLMNYFFKMEEENL